MVNLEDELNRDDQELVEEISPNRTQAEVEEAAPEGFTLYAAAQTGMTARKKEDWMALDYDIRVGPRGFDDGDAGRKGRKALLKYDQNEVANSVFPDIRYTDVRTIKEKNIHALRFYIRREDNFDTVPTTAAATPTPTPVTIEARFSARAKEVLKDSGRTIPEKKEGLKELLRMYVNRLNTHSNVSKEEEQYAMFLFEEPYKKPTIAKRNDNRKVTVLAAGPNTQVDEFDVHYQRKFSLKALEGAGEKLFGYELKPKWAPIRRFFGWINEQCTACGKARRIEKGPRKFYKVIPIENKYS